MSGVGGGVDKEGKRLVIKPLGSCGGGHARIGLIFRSLSVVPCVSLKGKVYPELPEKILYTVHYPFPNLAFKNPCP